jgi:hypothetical protein
LQEVAQKLIRTGPLGSVVLSSTFLPSKSSAVKLGALDLISDPPAELMKIRVIPRNKTITKWKFLTGLLSVE